MTQDQPASFWDRFVSWADADSLHQHEDKVLLILTLIIGAVVGLVVVAFILVTENLGARMYPPGAAAWRRVLIPVVGALVAGVLLKRYFPDARGSGIPQTKAALFLRGGVITFRTAVGKFCCSSISLATGIALGREGPSVQVAGGIASSLGRRLGLSPRSVEALVPIGSAAALAAAFNTPIAAVLFTLEEVMGNLHARVLGSIVLSSATSWVVLHLLLGDEPLFHVPAYQLVHPLEFAIYAVLGVLGGVVSVAFTKLLLWQRAQFARLPEGTRWIQPAAGGLLVGVLGWFVPEVLGVGYGFVSQALNGQMILGMMALLVALKVVATATCYSSGNAGGIFGPSLFIGAMLGGALGAGAHHLLPDYTGSVGAYALVGMGTAFAGIIRVPLTSVIMIFEVTRDYSIIVPLMISNLISYLVASRLQHEPIYEALQHQDGIYLPPGAGVRDEVLEVGQGYRAPGVVLDGAETVEGAAARIGGEPDAWPVVHDGVMLGMIASPQIEEALRDGRGQSTLAELLPAPAPRGDAAHEDFPHLHTDDPLDMALREMSRTGLRSLPVVSRANLRELIGVISLADIMAAYGLEKKQGPAKLPQPPAARTPTAALGGIVAVLVVAVMALAFLSYVYRTQRDTRARRYVKQANELMQANRYDEAVGLYRSALSISHSSDQRLELAQALAKAGHFNEAETYFREMLHEKPNSGPANLGLGRLLLQEGDAEQAVTDYHRAIYGAWPKDGQANREEVRLELIGELGKVGAKPLARAELLELRARGLADPALARRVAHLLLQYDLPKDAEAVYRELAQRNNKDAAAYAGLGEAELALNDFASAETALRRAVRLEPQNAAYRTRLQVVQQIVEIDPSVGGLRPSERLAASRKLLAAALGSLDRCLATETAPPADAVRKLAEEGHKALAARRPGGDSDILLAQRLWGERVMACGPATPDEEPVSRVMARMSH